MIGTLFRVLPRRPIDERVGGLAGGDVAEVEGQLVGLGAAQQQGFPDRVHDGGGVDRHGNRYSGASLDRLWRRMSTSRTTPSISVVGAVVGDRPDGRRGLAESVDAALSLLMSGGVPGEVVMQDGGESVLEVDAFGEAVGGDQDARPSVGVRSLTRVSRSSGGRVPVTASTRAAGMGFGEGRGEVLGEVLGRRDVSAEEDRVVAVLDKRH